MEWECKHEQQSFTACSECCEELFEEVERLRKPPTVDSPVKRLVRLPTPEDMIAVFKKNGMRIESGATYSVKGQIAQLVNGVREIIKSGI